MKNILISSLIIGSVFSLGACTEKEKPSQETKKFQEVASLEPVANLDSDEGKTVITYGVDIPINTVSVLVDGLTVKLDDVVYSGVDLGGQLPQDKPKYPSKSNAYIYLTVKNNSAKDITVDLNKFSIVKDYYTKVAVFEKNAEDVVRYTDTMNFRKPIKANSKQEIQLGASLSTKDTKSAEIQLRIYGEDGVHYIKIDKQSISKINDE